jgi:TIR domain
MKRSERFQLIDQLARELQDRFKTYELPGYLASMGLKDLNDEGIARSKWVWAKNVLAAVPIETVLAIAEDLEFDTAAFGGGLHKPPGVWNETSDFRVFISHVSAHKDKAMKLRVCLEPYAISGFVAHEDIEPTKPWEEELRRGLHAMDALVSMHTPGFSMSNWTQQEIGFAIGRGKKVIAFHMGEDPTGFLSKEQALLHKRRSAAEIAKEIDRLLSGDPRTSMRLAEAKRARLPKSVEEEIPF